MGDGGWTHEWLNASDALDRGDADPLLAMLINGTPIPDIMKEKILVLLDDPKLSFSLSRVVAGRPIQSSEFSLPKSLELHHLKEFFRTNSDIKVIEIENIMAEHFGTNLNYLRSAIKNAKELVLLMEKKGHCYTPSTINELQQKYPELFNKILK